ncbi:MAG: response regulator transcription factor [Clostridiales bacterium]|mgnify:CR=1 FL=1|jgi:two-component system response regulator VanR|nr:response regulator transcription factor [Clostridiales bacterium]
MGEQQILVVDDDKDIAELVEIHLTNSGYQVFTANNAKEGFDILANEDIQLVILDIMMPEVDGISMCKTIRKISNIPIIMLSAKIEDIDKIEGLSAGADDYITKPFNPGELIARVKSQLRRFTTLNTDNGNDKSKKVVLNNLIMNKDDHRVIAYGKEVKLTPIEFNILFLLASNPGKVFSTEEIFETVWNEKMFDANNTVMVHIRRLREKIEMDPRDAKIIKTVWGVGYKVEKGV